MRIISSVEHSGHVEGGIWDGVFLENKITMVRIRSILIFALFFPWGLLAAPEAPLSFWLSQPVAKLFVASYLTANEKTTEAEKMNIFLSVLEKSLFDRPPIRVDSLEDYLEIRNQESKSMEVFLSDVSERGLVNPLNIVTPNSWVYEQILNYEIDQLQDVLQKTLPFLPEQGPAAFEINSAIESLNLMLDTYRRAVGVRNEIEVSTRSWEGLPVLGFFRAVGRYVVTPALNSLTYSSPVIQQARALLRGQLADFRLRLPRNREAWQDAVQTFQIRVVESLIERNLARAFADQWFFKPVQSWPRQDLLNIGILFFKSLPQALQKDLTWYVLQNRNRISQPVALVQDYPRSELVLEHFRNWIQRNEVRQQFQKISDLPVADVLFALSSLIKSVPAPLENKSAPRWLGESGPFEFYVTEKAGDQNGISLADYFRQNPEQAGLLKHKIAVQVLQQAFEGGLTTILSRDVLMAEKKVYFSALGSIEAFPEDSSRRFIEAAGVLPLKALLVATPEESLDLYPELTETEKAKISEFLGQPENLRWALQLDQLRQMVGDSVFKKEVRAYVLKHPKYVFHFLKARWFPKSQIPLCRKLFATGDSP